ncbi:hypothetical protein SRABI111_01465 [Pseudomonas carnis]|uniref:Uncharacterized protein n=1 Tax=Pseudomonas fluorescens TaxID=294 RepID=A0A109L1C1_PSEFL|nr:hypothetical protein PFL603g_01608 [Pseudomonas fluorescens]CAH0174938.1 hypothetical protein SRABI08_01275 [Pseudomonas carnis]SFX43113.1 hypothetical protein SAMN03159316_1606 [Pseudomonas sp. NFR02]CAH0182536.1 hypothetical protein SRABI111_01465 [Pseudomonas carnis]CAH0284732.1 hypothetical protein SRABI110_04161 [Pseudomonas carnis]
MACREVRMLIHDFRRHFTNDDQAHDHSLLCSPVLQKLFFAQALYKSDRVSGSLPDNPLADFPSYWPGLR